MEKTSTSIAGISSISITFEVDDEIINFYAHFFFKGTKHPEEVLHL